MTLHITKSTDLITVQTLTILIYGSPGIGKTSLAFTADSPLLLDFDRGAYRSGYRKDSVQVERWSDVSSLSAADIAEYRTIIVDTVGRLLDAMTADIVHKNPKMQGFGGALSLQGYGALKAAYATWLASLSAMGKDIVLIAHDREEKRGDDVALRPDIQGGSYGEVFKRADGIGYMYRSGRSTILDFSPTDKWIGKNAAGFEPLVVPDFNQQGDYLGTVLADTKTALNRMSEEQQRIVCEISQWQDMASAANTAAEINDLIALAGNLSSTVAQQAKFAIASRAKALRLEYKGKKGAGQYVDSMPSDEEAVAQ